MKLSRTAALMAGCLLALSTGFAAGESVSGGDPGTRPAGRERQAAQVPLAEAQVRKLDRKAGTVTLSHGALPNGMPAMTMDYRLKEASWFGQLKEGQQIRIAVAEVAGAWTVVRLEPSK